MFEISAQFVYMFVLTLNAVIALCTFSTNNGTVSNTKAYRYTFAELCCEIGK